MAEQALKEITDFYRNDYFLIHNMKVVISEVIELILTNESKSKEQAI